MTFLRLLIIAVFLPSVGCQELPPGVLAGGTNAAAPASRGSTEGKETIAEREGVDVPVGSINAARSATDDSKDVRQVQTERDELRESLIATQRQLIESQQQLVNALSEKLSLAEAELQVARAKAEQTVGTERPVQIAGDLENAAAQE